MPELIRCPFCGVPREQRMILVRGTTKRVEVNCTPEICRGAEVLTAAGWGDSIATWNAKIEKIYGPAD